jgi:hypothetical protein
LLAAPERLAGLMGVEGPRRSGDKR